MEILQISADPVPSLKAWAEQLGGLPFPLLSDYWPHGAVGKSYGVFNDERGMDKRSAFLVDAQGVVRYMGGIDSIQSADQSDIAKATQFVPQTLAALAAGKPVTTKSSQPYGCTVKY